MKKDLFLFMAGGSIYPTLEVIWRGRTHISMAVAGGICLCLIDHICNRRMRRRPLLARCCAGSGIITCVELLWVLLSLPAMGLGCLLDRSRFLCGSPANVTDA